jgi:transposase InsO family protein
MLNIWTHWTIGKLLRSQIRKRLGIKQVRTPFRCPAANAVAERWVKSARTQHGAGDFILRGGRKLADRLKGLVE